MTWWLFTHIHTFPASDFPSSPLGLLCSPRSEKAQPPFWLMRPVQQAAHGWLGLQETFGESQHEPAGSFLFYIALSRLKHALLLAAVPRLHCQYCSNPPCYHMTEFSLALTVGYWVAILWLHDKSGDSSSNGVHPAPLNIFKRKPIQGSHRSGFF